jgi:polar amino acid transport system substrate-binding protein
MLCGPGFRTIFSALGVLLAAAPASTLARDLQVLTHPLDPLTISDDNGLRGMAVDLVDEIVAATGDHAVITVEPFARLLEDLQQGPNLAGFVIARTPEREAALQWVGPLIVSSVYVYVKAGSTLGLSTIDDLRAVGAIGVQNGNADDIFLTALGFTNLERRPSQSNALLGVDQERLSAVPVSELVFSRLAQEAGLHPESFKRTPLKLYDSALYLALSKDVEPDRVIRLSAALRALKVSGRYDDILARYRIVREAGQAVK